MKRRVSVPSVTAETTAPETILKLGAEGGSLSILRTRLPEGRWQFSMFIDESTLSDLLDEDDRQGLVFIEHSERVATIEAALVLLDRFQWYTMLPMVLIDEYAPLVLAEVERRGGAHAVVRWRDRLSRSG